VSAVLKAQEPNSRYLAAMRPGLVEHFDLVASAPGGVARLRELILTQAVRGKLVPQDPGDEPASELVARAKAQKNRRIAESSIRRNRVLAEADKARMPFDLPLGWEWIRLADVVRILNGRAYSKEELLQRGSTPVLRVGNLFTSNHWYYSNLQLDADKYCHQGDLLYAWSASFGPFIWNGPKSIFHYHVWKLDPIDPERFNSRYLHTFLQEKTVEIKASGHGVSMIHMTKEKMEQVAVPYPPLAEQARIVARVEELMRLCDALDAKGRLEDAQHAQLLNALLGTLTDSASPEELAANWQRVAAQFDVLLDRPGAIDALDRTVLDLAVRGSLVSQHASDEPAAALLRRMQTERLHLVSAGKRTREAPATAVAPVDGPFNLPQGWEWARFDQLIDPTKPISYGVLVPGPEVADGVPFVRIADLSLTSPAAKPEKKISPAVDAQYQRTRLVGGEILMGVVGSIGKLGVAPQSWAGANIARAICRIVPAPSIDRKFMLLLLESEFMQRNFAGDTRTLAQPTLNVGLIRAAPTPVPPLAEQHLIVARVNELRRLCADLREKLASSQATQVRLADALVESAGSAD